MRPAATDTRNLITQKDIACGSNEFKRGCDTSTDTASLLSLHDRASGLDVPPQLLARHVSTDTRTLVSTRDNFSATQPATPTVHIDAHTQFVATAQHDASSNTSAPAEQRHTGVQVSVGFLNTGGDLLSFQAIQDQPSTTHSTTSTELDIFHRLGHLRNSVSNTDSIRSTDRSTITERQPSRDLAMNTEAKIMYSKDVGDFDVRVTDDQHERHMVEQQEFTWNTLYGRRAPLHSQSTTYEQGLQTDLRDTKRDVGYVARPTKAREETMEEQRQETISFRLPQRAAPETMTEETYESTVTTGNRPYEEMRTQTKHDNVDTTLIKSETTEWTRSLGSTALKSAMETSREQRLLRSQSPEDLVEESYEVVSTVNKPEETAYLITSSRPKSTVGSSTTQRYTTDPSLSKPVSSEDDSSYCEEWTVTEAKRKQDGQTVKTIIDR